LIVAQIRFQPMSRRRTSIITRRQVTIRFVTVQLEESIVAIWQIRSPGNQDRTRFSFDEVGKSLAKRNHRHESSV
jgi:hypothetical protein